MGFNCATKVFGNKIRFLQFNRKEHKGMRKERRNLKIMTQQLLNLIAPKKLSISIIIDHSPSISTIFTIFTIRFHEYNRGLEDK
jgi:hypothetical protein